MRHFPINLDVRGRKALVVGGGRIACRKVASLLACDACVTVVSPTFCSELAETPGIVRIERPYRTADLTGVCLVISATDCREVNRQVSADADEAGVPCNVVDEPELCSFTLPAVLSRGQLTIAISTAGASPALAGRLRRELENTLSPAIEVQLQLLAEIRPRVKRSGLGEAERSRLLKAMAGESVCRMIEDKGEVSVREYLAAMLNQAAGRADCPQGRELP